MRTHVVQLCRCSWQISAYWIQDFLIPGWAKLKWRWKSNIFWWPKLKWEHQLQKVRRSYLLFHISRSAVCNLRPWVKFLLNFTPVVSLQTSRSTDRPAETARRHERAADAKSVLSWSPTLEGRQVGALIACSGRQTGRQRVVNLSHLCSRLLWFKQHNTGLPCISHVNNLAFFPHSYQGKACWASSSFLETMTGHYGNCAKTQDSSYSR